MYLNYGPSVIFGDKNETHTVANCESTETAVIAAAMLNKAYRLNYNRKYTASARIHAAVRELPGLHWCGNHETTD